ncbi:28 kDa ookinete surface protein, putative [Plasmodium relictum]|uniref:28 kDa ookinete surface protein, putative n=1 Tax=Plasmodium relictum TaxID=85471 RepID=A0A1J1H2P1_PLARL|nr:28 kDa ookinete surface protein, putative [Plasmodium relictum]CRG99171.1 28 kDa ookinete surface protein, putative [Plasmodium relictum]
MKFSYSFLFFLFIIISVILTEVGCSYWNCINGYEIQMSNHKECKCNNGYVNLDEDMCSPIFKCDHLDSTHRPCDNYSVCTESPVRNGQSKLTCQCSIGYIKQGDSCVPAVCKNIDCVNGKCIENPDNPDRPMCSCNIGKDVNPEDNGACTKDGTTECTLYCQIGDICKQEGPFYTCTIDESGSSSSGGGGGGGDGDGADGNDKDSSSGSFNRNLSVFNTLSIIFLIALFYII